MDIAVDSASESFADNNLIEPIASTSKIAVVGASNSLNVTGINEQARIKQ